MAKIQLHDKIVFTGWAITENKIKNNAWIDGLPPSIQAFSIWRHE